MAGQRGERQRPAPVFVSDPCLGEHNFNRLRTSHQIPYCLRVLPLLVPSAGDFGEASKLISKS